MIQSRESRNFALQGINLDVSRDAFNYMRHTVALTRRLLGEGSLTERPIVDLREYLMKACRSGTPEVVKLLLAYGAEPLPLDLNYAIRSGQLGITSLLLSHDVQLARPLVTYGGYQSTRNAVGKERFQREVTNSSPIIRAMLLEHTAMFRLLRGHGVRVNHPEVGGLALKWASEQGLESMVELLLEEGVPLHGQSCGLCPREYSEATGEFEFRHEGVRRTFAKAAGVPIDELPNPEICPHCEPFI
ncbi:uncharacterized protein BDZ99DRAFT_461437 [Mytilinidion resinicola]|uniref:Ankyrin n=1 Tax=Mytilinidion resinicola TaxID=574789 RepID=A0A6A6YS58_9PEZI|nr:uncharacterized protein BDZ99DRAFT_461437 [Mytilinidion resinicola]KAF2811349.1 hypothetical protein BDZ99DRAFT_461437 [Mytilinidion resinicola]